MPQIESGIFTGQITNAHVQL